MDIFRLTSDPMFFSLAELSFEHHRTELNNLVPFGEIEHIGSTAIPGALTKGDLDILIRVASVEDLDRADQILARTFQRNTASERNSEFSSFKKDDVDPPLGIQVALAGSRYDRVLATFRDRLRNSPSLLQEFNDLKSKFHGRPMDEYRVAKGKFVESVVS